MTVESNSTIEIATFSDLLKNLEPLFQPMRSKTKTKTKTNRTLYARFFPGFDQVTGDC